MEETKLRQLFKNRADAYLNTIDESVEQGMSEDCFIKAVKAAINYTHSCTELKDKKVLTLKDAFIAGYKKRALMSDLKYDEVSELNAITNFKCWKSFDLDL